MADFTSPKTETPAVWIPPNITDITFHSCETAVDWFTTVIKSGSYPTMSTLNMLMDGFPADSRSKISRYGEVMDWFLEQAQVDSQPLPRMMKQFASVYCRRELCPRLGWQGNPDLAGAGMLTSYFLQASIIIVYVAISLARRLLPEKGHRTLWLWAYSVERSVRTFFNASLLMTVAVVWAAMLSAHYSDDRKGSAYVIMCIDFVFVHSWLSPFILRLLFDQGLPRNDGNPQGWLLTCERIGNGIRYIMWGLHGILTLVQFLIIGKETKHPGMDTGDYPLYELQRIWEHFCLDWDLVTQSRKIRRPLEFIVVALFGCSVPMMMFEILEEEPDGETALTAYRAALNKWKIFPAAPFTGVLWFNLAMFIYYRKKFQNNSVAEAKEREVTLGQVLAVATWIPVANEFFTQWKISLRARERNKSAAKPWSEVDNNQGTDQEEETVQKEETDQPLDQEIRELLGLESGASRVADS